jgi:hypothetical protein
LVATVNVIHLIVILSSHYRDVDHLDSFVTEKAAYWLGF